MSAFRLLLPTAALAAALAATVCAQAQDGAFAAADKNGNGTLDKTEFRTFIDQLAEAGRPNAVKIKSSGRYDFAFGRIDKNGDGRITPDELSSVQ
ncbi:EF-hand domain-containing protein [Pseudochelatococcus sp. B33]